MPCNVAVEDSVFAAVDPAVARHGWLDIIMLNSAGVVGPLSPGTSQITSLDFAQFDAVMFKHNVHATLAGIKHSARVMLATPPAGSAAGRGFVLCMARISGILGELGTYLYSVSKFAIAGQLHLAVHGAHADGGGPVLGDAG